MAAARGGYIGLADDGLLASPGEQAPQRLYSRLAVLRSGLSALQEARVAIPGQTALQRSNLNAFLFASVGTEGNGMTLTVLSLFARAGSDPWLEARRLADLPKPEASESLARSIASPPESLWSLADSTLIAARLVDLLPTRQAASEARMTGLAIHLRLPSRTTLLLLAIAVCVGLTAATLLR